MKSGHCPSAPRGEPFGRIFVRRLLLPIAAALFMSTAAADAGKERAPDILFVMIDTLRADHVGCYGYGRDTTPTLDRLAAEGARFERMIAASSWTMPSVMTMFTSLHPSLHGATTYRGRLREGVATLAACLRESGFRTVGFTSNPTTHAKFGFGEGFDHYDDFTVMLAGDLNLFGDFEDAGQGASLVSSPIVTRLAIDWLRKHDDARPFFLFVLYFDPHADYVPPPPYDRMFARAEAPPTDGRRMHRRKGEPTTEPEREHIRALYDGEVRYTDEHVGKLLEAARASSEDLLTIVVSDHGEEFWDHGGTLHGHTLHEELVHVPCIVHRPGRIPAGRVVDRQASHLDLMPTLLGLAGVPIPKQCLGRSLLPGLTTPHDGAPDREAYLETEAAGADQIAVRTKRSKLICDLAAGTRRAFDLAADPSEMQPLPEDAAGISELAESIRRHWQLIGPARARESKPAEAPVLDEALKRRLRALGYMH